MRAGLRILSLLSALPLCAHITGLATDFDGSTLYFSTPLRLRGSEQPHHGKIFRWTRSSGIELFAERDRLLNDPGGLGTNFFDFGGPSVSADGSLVAFSAWRDCFPTYPRPGTACGYREQYHAIVRGAGGATVLEREDGIAVLSRNGRYLLVTPWFSLDSSSLLDLSRPDAQPVPIRGRGFGAVANDGTVVLDSWPLRLWNPATGARPFPSSRPAAWAALSPEGRIAVYEAAPDLLYSLDLASGRETFLFRGAAISVLGFSDDGSRLALAVSDPAEGPRNWLFTMGTDGSNPDWIACDPEGFKWGAVSGDGRVIYAVTPRMRVLRVDVSTHEVSEVLPASPWISSVTGSQLPGSANRVLGGGFTSVEGIRVDWNFRDVPVVEVAEQAATIQVPWDQREIPPCGARPDPYLLRVRVRFSPSGPFDDPEVWLRTCAQVPVYEPPALHENGAAITAAHPAVANETIRLFVTGLGPVDPPAETGVPTPENPPARLVDGISCQLAGQEAEVLFAGLAPGRVGVHEIRLRTPVFSAEQGAAVVNCSTTGRRSVSAQLPAR